MKCVRYHCTRVLRKISEILLYLYILFLFEGKTYRDISTNSELFPYFLKKNYL